MTRLFGLIAGLALALALPVGALAPLGAWALGGPSSFEASGRYGDRVVMVLGSRGNVCSGTVLRRDVVITAAHCLRGAKQIVVAYFENGEPVLQRVRRSVSHPQATRDYRRTVDVALVFLADNLPGRFRPTPLDAATSVRGPGESVVVAGFGLQRGSNLKSGGRLRAAESVIFPPATRRILRIGPYEAGALSVCKGDSGGPVFSGEGSPRLIGVVFGTEVDKQPALCGGVGQAIRIAPVRAWIDRQLAGG
jgi:S1-C subfamily serine protease